MILTTGQRVVLVIGGSSGIGLATARALHARGDSLALLARDPTALNAAAADLPGALTFACDVSDTNGVHAAISSILKTFGRLDAIVHAAQVMAYGRIENVPAATFNRVVDVALHGTANLARTALPVFRRQGHGTLIIVNSLLGEIATPEMGAYVSAKWGQLGLARVLQLEVQDTKNIHVCIVSPGAVDTPIYDLAATYVSRAGSPPPPVIGPIRVATETVRCLDHPRRHVEVGPTNRLTRLGFRLTPSLYDRVIRALVERAVFRGTAVAASEGNLFHPHHQPDPASGGWSLLGRRRPNPPPANGAGAEQTDPGA